MARRMLPPQEFLRECFSYDQKTGALRWKKRPVHHFPALRDQTAWNNKMAGKIAGCPVYTKDGRPSHLAVGIYMKMFHAHRIIWKLMTGKEPAPILDHRDRDPFNNRWKNLREADDLRNSHNTGIRSNSGSGLKGVWVMKRGKPFRAYIKANGRRISLGGFDTAEAAHAAYCEAAQEYFGEFHSPG